MDNSKCLFPGCEVNGRLVRGLCPNHYTSAISVVKSGRVTWDKLIELGKALPTKEHYRKGAAKWFLEGVK